MNLPTPLCQTMSNGVDFPQDSGLVEIEIQISVLVQLTSINPDL